MQKYGLITVTTFLCFKFLFQGLNINDLSWDFRTPLCMQICELKTCFISKGGYLQHQDEMRTEQRASAVLECSEPGNYSRSSQQEESIWCQSRTKLKASLKWAQRVSPLLSHLSILSTSPSSLTRLFHLCICSSLRGIFLISSSCTRARQLVMHHSALGSAAKRDRRKTICSLPH